MDNNLKTQYTMVFLSMGVMVIFALIAFILGGCTFSFQNISTNGKASDVVDETQDAKADISAQIPLQSI